MVKISEIKTILVTGGLSYIGSHTIVELFNENYLKLNNIIFQNKFLQKSLNEFWQLLAYWFFLAINSQSGYLVEIISIVAIIFSNAFVIL